MNKYFYNYFAKSEFYRNFVWNKDFSKKTKHENRL